MQESLRTLGSVSPKVTSYKTRAKVTGRNYQDNLPLLCTRAQWDLNLHGRVHSVLSVISSIESYKHLHPGTGSRPTLSIPRDAP